MKLPELELDTTFFGDWNTVESIEALIPSIADRYHKRYRRFYYGDADDLQQEARLALWLWLKEQGGAERVRELQALSIIHNAMQAEIEYTRRLKVEEARQGDVNWRWVAQTDRSLTEDQHYTLYLFRMLASKAARVPNWEAVWLVRGLDWRPEDVTAYWRHKKNREKFVPPEQVMKCVRKAEKRIAKLVPQSLVSEVARLSYDWWASGE